MSAQQAPQTGVGRGKYPLSGEMQKRLDEEFTYHPPQDDQPGRYNQIRTEARSFAETIVRNTPPGREQSLALTKLREAVMWANGGLSLEGTGVETGTGFNKV